MQLLPLIEVHTNITGITSIIKDVMFQLINHKYLLNIFYTTNIITEKCYKCLNLLFKIIAFGFLI